MKLSFGKDKKLKSRKAIERLFLEGKQLRKFPLKAVYILNSNEETPKVAVSVPKKLIKKAVDRNLLKRRIREAYRINQFKISSKTGLNVMFIYNTNQIQNYSEIEKAMLILLDDLNALSDANASA
ncbi:MAG TPA: ribonuclease P protein component [Moheibacter sp.]|nr:ribonuclease P protein component [Moheibacter sp.]